MSLNSQDEKLNFNLTAHFKKTAMKVLFPEGNPSHKKILLGFQGTLLRRVRPCVISREHRILTWVSILQHQETGF